MKTNLLKVNFCGWHCFGKWYQSVYRSKVGNTVWYRFANVEALAACGDIGYYSGLREYTAENGCFCLNCPE